jgi:SAM-dependent methyltransferase
MYDDFYGEIYDQLMLPKQRVEFESDKLIQTMQPSKKTSILLDVGSGTGEFVNHLTDLGYQAYGVDKSSAMIDVAKNKYPNIQIKRADVTDPMTYDMSLFTHIFCLDFTVYEIENKSRFFYNCHYWLQNGGYFILHLVDKDQFQPIVPAAGTEAASFSTERIRNTEINFPDFTYKSEYLDEDTSKCTMCHRETFVDKHTQNVRQNEKTLYMETIVDTLQKVISAGFNAKGFFTLEDGPSRDKHQKIYIFEKI